MLARLSGTISTIRTSADDMSEASHKLATAGDDVSSTVDEAQSEAKDAVGLAADVNRSVQGVSATVRQMDGTIQDIAGNVQQARDVVQQASRLGSITGERMDKLGQCSQDIGRVVRLIQTVAAQTNLLALNATIEAARAAATAKAFRSWPPKSKN